MTVVIVLAGSGCASFQASVKALWTQSDEPAPSATLADAPPADAEGLAAAARARNINMFGELAGFETPAYSARSAIALRQHTFSEEGRDFDADIDAGGGLMVFASTRHAMEPDLYLKSVSGVAVTQLTSDPASDIEPAFSPDGRNVAFASDRGGNWDIWLLGIDGGQPVQITSSPADEVHPSWSPDGRQLVFCSLPPGASQWELWVADAAAGATRKFIGYGVFPDWSPVSDTIVYQRARERGSRWFSIWTLTLVNGEPRYPVEVASSAAAAMILPAWSADGQSIAFTTIVAESPGSGAPDAAGGPSDIWMMQADGRGRTRLTDGYSVNFGPGFAPDGTIFFTSSRAGCENVWSIVPAVSRDPASVAGSEKTHASMASTVIEESASPPHE